MKTRRIVVKTNSFIHFLEEFIGLTNDNLLSKLTDLYTISFSKWRLKAACNVPMK